MGFTPGQLHEWLIQAAEYQGGLSRENENVWAIDSDGTDVWVTIWAQDCTFSVMLQEALAQLPDPERGGGSQSGQSLKEGEIMWEQGK